MEIIKSQFTENFSMTNGGAIAAENSNIILNGVLFDSNEAQLSGGALYLEESSVNINDLLTDIFGNVIITQIINNKAIIGGGIRYFNLSPPPILTNKEIFKGNTARLYGQNYAMYPK